MGTTPKILSELYDKLAGSWARGHGGINDNVNLSCIVTSDGCDTIDYDVLSPSFSRAIAGLSFDSILLKPTSTIQVEFGGYSRLDALRYGTRKRCIDSNRDAQYARKASLLKPTPS